MWNIDDVTYKGTIGTPTVNNSALGLDLVLKTGDSVYYGSDETFKVPFGYKTRFTFTKPTSGSMNVMVKLRNAADKYLSI